MTVTFLVCPENVVCFLGLLHIFMCTSDKFFPWKQIINMNSDQTAPRSSLIWVHMIL